LREYAAQLAQHLIDNPRARPLVALVSRHAQVHAAP
jgi:hypothetical protein